MYGRHTRSFDRKARGDDDVAYVLATYKALGENHPRPADVKRFAEELDNGQIKVKVVEDVALTLHPAGWWARALQRGSR